MYKEFSIEQAVESESELTRRGYVGNLRNILGIADVDQHVAAALFAKGNLHIPAHRQRIPHISLENERLWRASVAESDDGPIGLTHVGFEKHDILHPTGSLRSSLCC